jgi:hypothetical protein
VCLQVHEGDKQEHPSGKSSHSQLCVCGAPCRRPDKKKGVWCVCGGGGGGGRSVAEAYESAVHAPRVQPGKCFGRTVVVPTAVLRCTPELLNIDRR